MKVLMQLLPFEEKKENQTNEVTCFILIKAQGQIAIDKHAHRIGGDSVQLSYTTARVIARARGSLSHHRVTRIPPRPKLIGSRKFLKECKLTPYFNYKMVHRARVVYCSKFGKPTIEFLCMCCIEFCSFEP